MSSLFNVKASVYERAVISLCQTRRILSKARAKMHMRVLEPWQYMKLKLESTSFLEEYARELWSSLV